MLLSRERVLKSIEGGFMWRVHVNVSWSSLIGTVKRGDVLLHVLSM